MAGKGAVSLEGGGGCWCQMLPRWCPEGVSEMRSLVLETRTLVIFQRAVSRRDNDPEVVREMEKGIQMASQKYLT